MMKEPLCIGCVPYLNGKPLVDWFHSCECDVEARVVYAPPSELAVRLRSGELDVALVSTFEQFRCPGLRIVDNISVAADGPVKSVRLFSRVPFSEIECVALDTSSLTSVNLARILLKETYHLRPHYLSMPPNLDNMLAECDAGLIIGDLKLFDTPVNHILDMGAAWKDLTGLPFVYAAWLASDDADIDALAAVLVRAKEWGCQRLEELTAKWSSAMSLPIESVRDYFFNVMRYEMGETEWSGLREFKKKCLENGLVSIGGS